MERYCLVDQEKFNMSSRQLSSLTLDRLEESLSRFYLQERSSSTMVSTGSGSSGSSGSSKDHHRFKLTATETKVVQETTHREVVLESYTENGRDHADSDADSYDDGPEEQQSVCYEVPSVEVVGYSAESSHRYDEKEYYSYEEEHQGSVECYEGSSGYDGGYDGGYEVDSYGGQSDYGGYYDQGGYGDYY